MHSHPVTKRLKTDQETPPPTQKDETRPTTLPGTRTPGKTTTTPHHIHPTAQDQLMQPPPKQTDTTHA
jgi:hypothetical protein